MTDLVAFDATAFLQADLLIRLHASAAMIAIAAGPFAIYRRRRDRLHKTVGYLWVGSMAIAALSAFGISSFPLVGPFSPIHILAVTALISLWHGVRLARQGRIAAHGQTLKSLYWRGLLVAGAFNFLPGRVINRTFFEDAPDLGYVPLLLILALIAGQFTKERLQARRNPRHMLRVKPRSARPA